ncbi:MAG TPA: hypothetical protein VH539_05705 [Gemmatimonadaceae bacterium]|jgi:hypothetical protein
MVHRWASPALGLLACFIIGSRASSQVSDQREGNRRRGVLSQNEPNPFSRETTIPFTVGDAQCAVGTQQHVVTIRIYNILSQVVATPMLVDSTAADGVAASAQSRALSNVSLACGSYTARWDGKHARNNRAAAPGVYMYQLVIDGHPSGMRKMLLKR